MGEARKITHSEFLAGNIGNNLALLVECQQIIATTQPVDKEKLIQNLNIVIENCQEVIASYE